MLNNKVEICGVNTAKLPILKADEKKELFNRILEGDEEAREQYIYGNLRLVLSIIQRFCNRGEHIDDIFQVGCIGLIKAIDNFDIQQGVQFSTYAVPIGVIRRNSLFVCHDHPGKAEGIRDIAVQSRPPLLGRRFDDLAVLRYLVEEGDHFLFGVEGERQAEAFA